MKGSATYMESIAKSMKSIAKFAIGSKLIAKFNYRAQRQGQIQGVTHSHEGKRRCFPQKDSAEDSLADRAKQYYFGPPADSGFFGPPADSDS